MSNEHLQKQPLKIEQYEVVDSSGKVVKRIYKSKTLRVNHFYSKEEAINNWRCHKEQVENSLKEKLSKCNFIVTGTVTVIHNNYEYEIDLDWLLS